MISLLGIFGAKGHGRDVLLFARNSLEVAPDTQIVFIDDSLDERRKDECGVEVLSFEQYLAIETNDKAIAVTVAATRIRKNIVKRIRLTNSRITSLTSRDAIIASNVTIGTGSIVSPYCTISTNAKIGEFVLCNVHSSIAHDCVIDDFVTIGPGVRCSGCVQIDRCAYIGTGAMIHQGSLEHPLKIGSDAVVGMGAVVLSDVVSGETVVGNPAKNIRS